MTTTVHPYGDRAVLVDGIDPHLLPVLARRLLAAPGTFEEVVAGGETLMLRLFAGQPAPRAGELDRLLVDCSAADEEAPVVTIPVRFDGPDLDAAAANARRSKDQLLDELLAARLRVAFLGFAAGFAYLDGVPEALHLPRRSTPRTRVPAGSFAVAAGYAAVYPTASPGGWHLLGTTDLAVWDLDRDPPALLTPGTLVRVEAHP